MCRRMKKGLVESFSAAEREVIEVVAKLDCQFFVA